MTGKMFVRSGVVAIVAVLALYGLLTGFLVVTGRDTIVKKQQQDNLAPHVLTVKSEHHSTKVQTIDALVCDVNIQGSPSIIVQVSTSEMLINLSFAQAQTLHVGDWQRFVINEATTVATYTNGTSDTNQSGTLVKLGPSPISPPTNLAEYCATTPGG